MNMKSKSKRYWFSCVEEMVMNPDYKGYSAFRVEVFDRESDSQYAVYEASFLIPEEFFDRLRDVFDGKESDLMPRIIWNVSTQK